MLKELVVCDVCENPQRKTKLYAVSEGDRTRSKDLCEEHAAPLEAFLTAPTVKVRARTPNASTVPRRAPRKVAASAAPHKATRGRQSAKIMTMEEIEAAKRKSKS